MRRAASRRRQGKERRGLIPGVESLEELVLLSTNPIVTENQLPGTPSSTWQVAPGGDPTLQGFTTDISVNHGQTVSFKINDTASALYHIDIYRMGYYGGSGARLVTTIPSSQTTRTVQPAPLSDPTTGEVDAGNWSTSASWSVPATATSGIYFADLVREDTGGKSQVFFVVRADESHSDILFQTSDSTWQAYNTWGKGSQWGNNSYGGNSLYQGSFAGTSSSATPGRAYAVSYNRPLMIDATTGGYGDYNSPWHGEYPMVRWLEANGYDVSYFTDVDAARYGSLILNHRVYMDVGHDEYWSAEQRNNVEAALEVGVNLAFFSGNEVFWKTRWANSLDGSASSYRTLVCYKESIDNAVIDPADPPTWTGTWRDNRFSPPADGGLPENALTGNLYMDDRTNVDLGIPLQVPAADANSWFWKNTSVANLQAGQVATLGQYIVGYEVNEDLDNGFRPAGLIDLSSTTFTTTSHVLVPWGTVVGSGTSTHSLTLYRASNGALVFGAGTVQWSWGLDGNHNDGAGTPDINIEQATVNLLANMYAQPATLQPGLVVASPSTDVTPPTSTITSPSAGASFAIGSSVTITGTAVDAGGGSVAGVEVSADSGRTWHPAVGRASWSYTWVPDTPGPLTILSRAVDDSGNLESPAAGVSVSAFYQPTSTANLVAAYGFNEGSGTTVTDASGHGNNGTISGATWTTGIFGNALSFNGTNSWVTISNSSSLNLSSGMTLEAWVDPTIAASGYTAVMIKERTNGLAYGLYATDGGGSPPGAYVDKSGTDYNADGLTTLPLNTWTYVAGTYDGTNLDIYVNGTLVSSETVGGNIISSTGALRIGGDSIWGEYFKGLIDEVRVYNAALNQGQIRSDMNMPVGSTQTETVPPTVAIASPTGGASVSGVTTLTANASDNVSVASVQFLLNGQFLGSRLFAAPYSLAWDTRTVPDGTYTLTARARDSAGNVTNSSSITVTVNNPPDTTPPTITLLNPTNGGLVAGTIVPWAVASDNIGVASVQFQVDGVNVGAAETAAPYRIAWNSNTVADGTHTLTAIATDAAGTQATSNAVSVTIKNTPAAVTGTTPANGATGVLTTLSSLTVSLSMAVQPSTISFVLASPSGSAVPGTISYNASTNVVTFAPAVDLAPTTTYTATISNAQNLAGSAMAPFSWSFTTNSTISGATIWESSVTPTTPAANDPYSIELGVKFRSDVAGYITGIRFYKGSGNTGAHVGHLWTSTGTLLTSATFSNETATGWQEVDFTNSVAIAANTTYVASYLAPNGNYAADSGYFASAGVDSGVLHALSNSTSGGDGVYLYGSGGFPTNTFSATNYWVDVVFGTTPTNTTPVSITATSPAAGATGVSTTAPNISATFNKMVQPSTVSFVLTDPSGNTVPATLSYNSTTQTETLLPSVALTATTMYTATISGAEDLSGISMTRPFSWTFTTTTPDTTPPTVVAKVPAAAATTASLDTTVTATFSEPVQSSTLVFTLTGPGGAVAAALSYNASTNTAILTPSAPLAVSTTYTASVSGVQDLAGNTMTGAVTWSFTTAPLIAGATIWSSSATPSTPAASDSNAVELGVKFRSDVDGYVTGIRFYKGSGNTGTHVGYLWTATGTLLASATFANETATGWQEVDFTNPVAITANTTYVASYFAPAGHYAANGGYFASTGVDNGVLHALSSTAAGGNGVYAYGSSGVFPTNSYNGTNYWVDVVYSDTLVNTTPPSVIATTPTAGATNVSFGATVNATFNEAVQLNTVSFVLKDASGNPVSATVSSGEDSNNTLTLTPHASLSPSTTYTVTISGAQSLSGIVMASPVTWSFTTAPVVISASIWSNTSAPANPSADDFASVELGLKFRSDVAGYITGVRFYKGTGNSGTHVGHLWDSSGNLLATATFTNETATGWQQVNFSSPVAIAANLTYVASYLAPNGHYAADGGYFASAGVDNGLLHALSNSAGGGDGVFLYTSSGGFPSGSYNSTNYWVDVVFSDVIDTTPPSVIATTPAAGATGVAPGSNVTATFSESVQANTISFLLKDANGNALASTVSYNGATHTATLTPVFPMAYSTSYTATLSGAQDLSGNTMASVSWSFTTTNLWQQTTAADFNGGSQSSTMVTNANGGEIRLLSSYNENFDEGSLSSVWTTTSWAPAGGGPTSVTLSGNVLSVGGAEVLWAQTIPAGVGVEASVNFGAAPYQHFGMATDFSSSVGNDWAVFSTMGTTDTLYARVNVSGTTQDVSLGALPSGFHDYRIQPVSGGIQFMVDGVVLTTINLTIPVGTPLRIAMSEFGGSPQPALQVDWVSLTSYASSGTFTSSVFDAGRTAAWGNASWTASVPAGTAITVLTSSSTDGVNWSSWSTVANGGAVASPSGRYLRYQVILTTSDPTLTPTLSGIGFTWN